MIAPSGDSRRSSRPMSPAATARPARTRSAEGDVQFRFESYVLDLATRELRHASALIALEPQRLSAP